MKKIVYTIGLSMSLLVFVACSENAKNEKEVSGMTENTESGVNKQVNGNGENTAGAENGSAEANTNNGEGSDKVSADYNKQISFNGVMITPPKSHSTVTLTMGGSIESLSIFPGDYVKKGQVIATLKNPDFIQLQQEFLTASAQVEYLGKEYQRQEKLASGEAASLKKLQQSKSDYLSEKSRLEAARAQLALLNVDTEKIMHDGIKTYLEVKAPISGYITNMQTNVGQYFEAGKPICDIIDKTETMLLLTAYEKDLAYISVGEKVDFTVNGIENRSFQAEISAIDQMVNSDNRSINVYARVKGSDAMFRQGMYVSAVTHKN